MPKNSKKEAWLHRKRRVRKRVRGRSERPRLCVFRSSKHVYAQIIDDSTGATLVAASTLGADFRALGVAHTATVEAASKVGELIASKALARSIQAVVFDRNGFLYHGRVKAVAEGARSAGLGL